jgi:AcrR family transcriptional regulator
VSRRVDLPSADQARHAMAEVISEAQRDGKRPSVLALARRLGLTNPTFWRHFPDIAAEMAALGRTPAPEQPESSGGSRYEQLQQDNARLKRRLAQTEADLQAAFASIQRLALDNDRLRRELEAATNVTRIDRGAGQAQRAGR